MAVFYLKNKNTGDIIPRFFTTREVASKYMKEYNFLSEVFTIGKGEVLGEGYFQEKRENEFYEKHKNRPTNFFMFDEKTSTKTNTWNCKSFNIQDIRVDKVWLKDLNFGHVYTELYIRLKDVLQVKTAAQLNHLLKVIKDQHDSWDSAQIDDTRPIRSGMKLNNHFYVAYNADDYSEEIDSKIGVNKIKGFQKKCATKFMFGLDAFTQYKTIEDNKTYKQSCGGVTIELISMYDPSGSFGGFKVLLERHVGW